MKKKYLYSKRIFLFLIIHLFWKINTGIKTTLLSTKLICVSVQYSCYRFYRLSRIKRKKILFVKRNSRRVSLAGLGRKTNLSAESSKKGKDKEIGEDSFLREQNFSRLRFLFYPSLIFQFIREHRKIETKSRTTDSNARA